MSQKWRDDAQIYYFAFTLGGGTVHFGFVGTEKQWDGELEDHYQHGDEVKLISKEFKCTGKEQREHSAAMTAAFKAASKCTCQQFYGGIGYEPDSACPVHGKSE